MDQLDQQDTAVVTRAGTAEGRASLGNKLAGRFAAYRKDRRNAEQQWLLNVRQYLGKYDQTLESNMAKGNSRAYPKITRVKCTSMKSRLMSLLFPAGEKNWSLAASPVPNLPSEVLVAALDAWRAANPGKQPTNDQLERIVSDKAAEIADRQEKVIDDQLQDIDPYNASDYETLVGKVVTSAVMYGPGIAKGPMTIADKLSRYELDANGMPQVLEIDGYRPYLEFVSCWNYYPEMGANAFEQMEGEFQRHVYSKHQAAQMAKRADFDGKVIMDYIRSHPDGNYQKLDHETELHAMGGSQNANIARQGGKYELLEYWGSALGSDLAAAGVDGIADDQLEDDIRYTAWILDSTLIKVAKNPFPEGTKVYHQFVFEEDEVNLLGSGLPPIMRDSQLAIATGARMLIDNASVACGPNVEVDVDLLDPNQTDMSIKPFKVWRKEGGQPGQRAINAINFESRIPEILQLMSRFEKFADTETFVSPMTNGDMEGVSGEAMRTTGGASMVYGNAALPFRDIVRNFDRFTTSVISGLVEWNHIFNADRDELVGDTRPIPRGATSLMAKEMRSFALDNLAQTLTPEDSIFINRQALLEERLKVRDLPLDRIMATKDQIAQNQQNQQQAQAQQQAQQQAMAQAQLENLNSDTAKQLTQAQKNLDSADATIYKALIDAIQAGASLHDLSGITARASQSRQAVPGASPVSGVGAVPSSAGIGLTQ